MEHVLLGGRATTLVTPAATLERSPSPKGDSAKGDPVPRALAGAGIYRSVPTCTAILRLICFQRMDSGTDRLNTLRELGLWYLLYTIH